MGILSQASNLSLLVFLGGCASGLGSHKLADCVSVVEARNMIGRGERVDSMCGYLRYGFEDKNLYDSKGAANQQDSSKCISVGIGPAFAGDLNAFDGKWVVVSGSVVDHFCPEGVICPSACSDVGVFIDQVRAP